MGLDKFVSDLRAQLAAMQKERDEARADATRLREMLGEVEWVIGFSGGDKEEVCAFCDSMKPHHDDGCRWVQAMKGGPDAPPTP